jgi:uncharacterized membrane protein YdbT with pleckstrin-like domain
MIFVGPLVAIFVGLTIIYVASSKHPIDSSVETGARFLGSLLILIGIFREISALLRYLTTEVAATTRRFVVKRGLLRRSVIEMNAGQLESIIIDQSVFGRILGYGTIIVGGTGN